MLISPRLGTALCRVYNVTKARASKPPPPDPLMNFASPVSYPDVDSAAFDWSAVKPQFADWQTEQIHNLAKKALDVLYSSDKSEAYKCGYSKTILHTIQNIALIKTENKKQM